MKRIEIVTDRLTLKPLGTEYLQTVNEYALDYENTKYMFYLPNETAEETMRFLREVESEWKKEAPEYYEFAILRKGRHMGTTRFIAHCDAENIASYKIMEKLGMIRTGACGGRRNRSAAHDSVEYQYELTLPAHGIERNPL